MSLPPLPIEYSASLVRSDGGRLQVYLRNDRRRVEMIQFDGQRNIVIARGDLGVSWLWNTSDPWLEQTIDWEVFSRHDDPSVRLDWKEEGSANVNGEDCAIFRGYAIDGKLQEECFVQPFGIRRRTITHRTDGSVGIVVDCVEVKRGPPAAEFFDLPKNAEVWQLSDG